MYIAFLLRLQFHEFAMAAILTVHLFCIITPNDKSVRNEMQKKTQKLSYTVHEDIGFLLLKPVLTHSIVREIIGTLMVITMTHIDARKK